MYFIKYSKLIRLTMLQENVLIVIVFFFIIISKQFELKMTLGGIYHEIHTLNRGIPTPGC